LRDRVSVAALCQRRRPSVIDRRYNPLPIRVIRVIRGYILRISFSPLDHGLHGFHRFIQIHSGQDEQELQDQIPMGDFICFSILIIL